jgi:TonB family protein
MPMFLGAVILATTTFSSPQSAPAALENSRFFSPNGELCLVVRSWPGLGDFERATAEAYYQRDPIEEWLDQYPLPEMDEKVEAQPVRGALYRLWPGGRQERLSELAFGPHEPERVLISDDGHVITYFPVRGDGNAELMTIRTTDGSVVRTLLVRDVLTDNDWKWLSRGAEDDVRWSIHDDPRGPRLRATILVTEGRWNDPEARHETREIDLATGAVPPPDRNLCPASLIVAAEPDDGSSRHRATIFIGDTAAFDAADVDPIASQALLDRATERVTPEYPTVAYKARIAGRVRVEVVVGRDGRVEAARIQPLPFGIDQAVAKAVVNWTFAPHPSVAAAIRYSGSFVFRFEIVRNSRIETTTVTCH